MPRAGRSSSNVATGRASIARVLGEQAGRLSYAHGSAFTTEPLEAYAAEIGPRLPVDDPAIYPVSGASEAIETALKLARAYHIARGETDPAGRLRALGELPRQHARRLDLSGRRPLRRPYEGWLGRFRHLSAAYPYRAADPDSQALATGPELAAELDRTFSAAEPGSVAAFVAEPNRRSHPGRRRAARRLLAAHRRRLPPPRRPPDRRRGDDRLRADGALVRARSLAVNRRTSSSPPRARHRAIGRSASFAASGTIHDTVMGNGGFVHGFTYSHAPAGAAVAREVLRILDDEDLVEAQPDQGRSAEDDARRPRRRPRPPR